MPIISKFCLAHLYLSKYRIARYKDRTASGTPNPRPRRTAVTSKKNLKRVEKRTTGQPKITISELYGRRRLRTIVLESYAKAEFFTKLPDIEEEVKVVTFVAGEGDISMVHKGDVKIVAQMLRNQEKAAKGDTVLATSTRLCNGRVVEDTAEKTGESLLASTPVVVLSAILGRTPTLDEYKDAVEGIDLTKFAPPIEKPAGAKSAHL